MTIELAYQHDALWHPEGFRPLSQQWGLADLLEDGLATEQSLHMLLRAPTGAGKTTILANLIAAFSERVGVLWLTPGAGGLADQARSSLAERLPACNVEMLGGANVAKSSGLNVGDVFVVNWEKITGGADLVAVDTERATLDTLLGNTNVPVVVVVDEAHQNLSNGSTQSSQVLGHIVSRLPLTFRIDVTATPKQIAPGVLPVTVERDRVVDSGMIRKTVMLNDEIQSAVEVAVTTEDATASQIVLQAAYDRLLRLKSAYRSEGSSVRPLLLVQIDNGAKGQTQREFAERFFADLSITESNGRLAVWFSAERSPDLEGIRQNDSLVEVLLFKSAIALGWDCPRAQVLAAFRESKSAIFTVQTLGRILRNAEPQRGHFATDLLNHAYVYTNTESDALLAAVKQSEAPESFAVALFLREGITPPTLPARTVTPKQTTLDHPTFRTLFAQGMRDQGLVGAIETFDQSLRSGELLQGRVDNPDAWEVTATAEVAYRHAGIDLENAYNSALASIVAGSPGRNDLVESAHSTVATVFGEFTDDFDVVQRFVIARTSQFALAATSAMAGATSTIPAAAIDGVWTLPVTIPASLKSGMPELSATAAAYRTETGSSFRLFDQSEPERRMVEELQRLSDRGIVEWWHKMGTRPPKQDLSLGGLIGPDLCWTYVGADGSEHNHFPDFIAELSERSGKRRLLVIETKDQTDDSANTAHKMAAMHDWTRTVSGLDVVYATVVPVRDHLLANDGSTGGCVPAHGVTFERGWRAFEDLLL